MKADMSSFTDRMFKRLVELEDETAALLQAPCLWCEYNGAGYWQPDTHDSWCPWNKIGGEKERTEHCRALAKDIRTK